MQDAAKTLTFGGFCLDRDRRKLTAAGELVALHGRAFDILDYMIGHRERPVSREEILQNVWQGVNVGDNNLAVQMSSLRRILAQHGGEELIITVPNRGYRFVGDVGQPEVAPQDGVSAVGPGSVTRHNGMPTAPSERHDAAHNAGAAVGRPGPIRRPPFLSIAAGTAALLGGVVLWSWISHAPMPAQPAAMGTAFNPPPHSVAVLAFTNLSGDPAQDYLSDGLSEELIEALSRVRQVQVTARTSSFFYKGKAATVGEIARALNVAAILEGSLRRQGNHLRIEARLTDARTGFQIWSQPFDAELRDALKLEGEIATQVAGALQVKLADGDAPDATAGGTKNPRALDAFLRGVQAIRQAGLTGSSEALSAYRQAIAFDPNFALAYAGKANALIQLSDFQVTTDTAATPAMMKQALAAAERAVQLAPNLGATHIARAYVLENGFLDVGTAWAEAQQAEALAPGNATVELLYATIAMAAGRTTEGLNAAGRALALDSLRYDGWMELGLTRGVMRDYQGAFEAYRHAETVNGKTTPLIAFERGLIYIFMGDFPSAQKTCAGDDDVLLLTCRAIADHAVGQRKTAEQALRQVSTALGDNGAYLYIEVYAQWGDHDQALRWLEKARALQDGGLTLMRNDPLLAPIRQEPRFRQVAQTLNFPD